MRYVISCKGRWKRFKIGLKFDLILSFEKNDLDLDQHFKIKYLLISFKREADRSLKTKKCMSIRRKLLWKTYFSITYIKCLHLSGS